MANPNSSKFSAGIIPTDTDLLVGNNDFGTKLTANISQSDTTIPVESTSINLPAILKIGPEYILAPSKVGNSFTSCVRAFKGVLSAHLAGEVVEAVFTEDYHNQIAAEVKAIATKLLTPRVEYITFNFNDPSVAVANSGSNLPLPTITMNNSDKFVNRYSLPLDWTGQIDVEIYWFSSVNTGNVTFTYDSKCMKAGDLFDAALDGGTTTATTTVNAVANKINKTTLTNIPTTNYAAGELVGFKVTRSSSTLVGAITVAAVRVKLRRL
jgi:hypothetical protein